MKAKNPRTKGEWQEAVDAAHGLVVLDSARLYGLVMGGPKINVERACEILKLGKAKGILPAKDAIEKTAQALC